MTAKHQKSPPGASLRAAAAELGVSRKKLLRLIRDGLPVTRHSERVYVDVAKARDWIALNDLGDGNSHAPSLHPDDPRYKAKLAAMQLAWIRDALAAGVLIDRKAAIPRRVDQMAEFRTALLNLPHHFVPHEIYDSAAIDAALEEVLAVLKDDDAANWPTPRPVAPYPEAPKSDGEEVDNFAARFRSSDPRHAFHSSKAAKAELELAELYKNVLPLPHALEILKERNDEIRSRIRQIPNWLSAEDYENICDRLAEEIDSALADLSGCSVAEAA